MSETSVTSNPKNPLPNPVKPIENNRGDLVYTQSYSIELFYQYWSQNKDLIKHQFYKLNDPDVKSSPEQFSEGLKSYNKHKSKYSNVLPFNNNRVILNPIEHVKGSDFINASLIKDPNDIEKYIASQAPLPDTLNDFWRMNVQLKVKAIIMLASTKQCIPYWDDNNNRTFGNIVVKVENIEDNHMYMKRKLVIYDLDSTDATRIEIDHYLFDKWPDHSVPDESQSLLALIDRVNTDHPKEMPILVHCSAGVGRTGTYIALDSLLETIKENKEINVFNYVNELRTQRVMMVQAPEQYTFIHTALIESYLFKNSLMKKPNYSDHYYKLLTKTDKNPKEELIQLQFKNLREFENKIRKTTTADTYPNIFKSPFKPYDNPKSIAVLNQYDNSQASKFYDSTIFQSSQIDAQFLVATDPDDQNVVDFIRLIRTYKPDFIISMTKCNLYFPKEKNSKRIDKTIITKEVAFEDPSNKFKIHKLLFKFNEKSKEEDLKVLYINTTDIWPVDMKLPDEKDVYEYNKLIYTILTQMFHKNNKSKFEPLVLVHSKDAGDRCGILIASILLINRIFIHEQFNVVLVVRLLRRMRKNMISTIDAYKFLYSSSIQFLDKYKNLTIEVHKMLGRSTLRSLQ